jgi:polyisoprenoid-binding protein YceI
MKKVLLLLIIVFTSLVSNAQYKPVEQGSTLKFTIKNLGFNVDGSFSGFEGTINFEPRNPESSNFDISINAASVNTDNSLRDEHLKGEGYFDVKNNPRIRMVSTKVTRSKNNFLFAGTLYIKGRSKPVSFPFTATRQADGYIFSGTFKMNRKDFGIGGTSTVADELQVNIYVTAKK